MFQVIFFNLLKINFFQVSATDIDEGNNGRVRYSIASGDDNRDFSISEDSGVVRVAKNLNYERKPRYLVKVRAEDGAGASDMAELSITVADINDNPPTFTDSPYLAYVMENIIPPNGGYVITVKAYDADTPPFNNQVRYFIKEGDADLFRINASTGEISLLRALDRETQPEYTLTLVAMDTGKIYFPHFFFLIMIRFNNQLLFSVNVSWSCSQCHFWKMFYYDVHARLCDTNSIDEDFAERSVI